MGHTVADVWKRISRAASAPRVHELSILPRAESQCYVNLTAFRWPDFVALAAVVAFGLVALQPVLHAQFVLIDGHEIVRLTLPDAPPPFTHLIPLVTRADLLNGRLRPVYWTLRFAGAAVFGRQPEAWHLAVVSLGLATAGLLYATARTLLIPTLPAALLAGWLLVAPGVSSIWIRLGTNETPATLFLVSSMFLAVMSARARTSWTWDVGFVLAAIAAILSKESFALAGPALVAFRILAHRVVARAWRLSISAVIVILAGAVLTLAAIVVASSAGTQSYGGGFLSSPKPFGYLLDGLHNLAIFLFASCAAPTEEWGGHMYWLAAAVMGWAVLTTFVRPLRMFGPGFHYMKASVFPSAYALAVIVNIQEGLSLGLAAVLVCVLASLAALAYFYRLMARRETEHTAHTPPDLAEAASHLKTLPGHNVLVLPTMYADSLRMLRTRRSSGADTVAICESLKSSSRSSADRLNTSCAPMGVDYLVLDGAYVGLEPLQVGDSVKLMSSFGSIGIYKFISTPEYVSTIAASHP